MITHTGRSNATSRGSDDPCWSFVISRSAVRVRSPAPIDDPKAGHSIQDHPSRVRVRHRGSLPATRGHGQRQRLGPLSGQPQPSWVARQRRPRLGLLPGARSPRAARGGPLPDVQPVDVDSLRLIRPRSIGVEQVGLWALDQLDRPALAGRVGCQRRVAHRGGRRHRRVSGPAGVGARDAPLAARTQRPWGVARRRLRVRAASS